MQQLWWYWAQCTNMQSQSSLIFRHFAYLHITKKLNLKSYLYRYLIDFNLSTMLAHNSQEKIDHLFSFHILVHFGHNARTCNPRLPSLLVQLLNKTKRAIEQGMAITWFTCVGSLSGMGGTISNFLYIWVI